MEFVRGFCVEAEDASTGNMVIAFMVRGPATGPLRDSCCSPEALNPTNPKPHTVLKP